MREPPPLVASRVRGLVFDLDGTLVDSYHAIAESLNHARERSHLPPLPVALVRRRVGRGLEQLIAELVGPERVEEGVRAFRERYAEVFAAGTTALPGVPRTLAGLAASGYRMAVASNKPARFSRPILEHLGLAAHIEAVLGPDIVGAAKPEPPMILGCLERLGLTPADAVYVGDMVLDVESAARAGLPVVLVPGGSATASELGATGQTVLGTFDDLGALFPRAPAPSPPAAG